MREPPILFSAPIVHAITAGRKVVQQVTTSALAAKQGAEA